MNQPPISTARWRRGHSLQPSQSLAFLRMTFCRWKWGLSCEKVHSGVSSRAKFYKPFLFWLKILLNKLERFSKLLQIFLSFLQGKGTNKHNCTQISDNCESILFRIGTTFEMRTVLYKICSFNDKLIMHYRVFISKQIMWGEGKTAERQKERESVWETVRC